MVTFWMVVSAVIFVLAQIFIIVWRLVLTNRRRR
jgi:hypothetical protein